MSYLNVDKICTKGYNYHIQISIFMIKARKSCPLKSAFPPAKKKNSPTYNTPSWLKDAIWKSLLTVLWTLFDPTGLLEILFTFNYVYWLSSYLLTWFSAMSESGLTAVMVDLGNWHWILPNREHSECPWLSSRKQDQHI